MFREVSFPATDGLALAGDLYEPQGPAEAAVVIGSATGVPRRLYQYFAEFLAEGGLATLAFDYRGIGGSLAGPLRGFQATAEDWGVKDIAGAHGWLGGQFPQVPLLHVGHSIGGQLLGLSPTRDRVHAALLIAAQSGHWRHWGGLARLGIFLFWYAAVPVLCRLYGYLPMRRLVGGEDVPRGVALQWMEWGRHPDYVLSSPRARAEQGFASFARPLRLYGFSDDRFAPPAAVDALARMYATAPKDVRHLTPGQLGMKKTGHFGCFMPWAKPVLWTEVRAWLLEQARR